MKQTLPSIWDKKAKQYSRYSPELSPFQARIFETLQAWGVDFKGKSIIDIGCGTGVYTLHLAKDALHVNALDFSQEMLDLLKEDAQSLGLIERFTFTCSTWDDYVPEPYDIAFASMTPALQTSEHLEKLCACTTTCVYLGWGGKRESSVLDPVFKAHGKALNVPEGAERIRAWLEERGQAYQSEYLEEVRRVRKSYKETFESVLWHFEINQIVADERLIASVLTSLQESDGQIETTTTIGVELIVWENG